MRIAFSLLLSVCLLCVVTFSLSGYPLQQQEGKSTDGQQPPSPPVVKQPLSFGLEDGTPVKLRTNRTISSSDAHVNDTLDFEVLDEVKVHDVVVIPRGGIAWGTVTEIGPFAGIATSAANRHVIFFLQRSIIIEVLDRRS